jgi:integrase
MAMLAAIPDRGRADKGAKLPTFSRTKIRLRCFAYSQLTAGQMMRLAPEDIDLEAKAIRLPRRFKGRGSEARWVPLVAPAVEAFRDFIAHGLFGRFSTSSAWKSFNRAAAQVGLGPLRVYDLRHSFASALVAASKDDGAAQMALQHGSPETTRRYTEAAVDPRIKEAMSKLDETLGEHIGAT